MATRRPAGSAAAGVATDHASTELPLAARKRIEPTLHEVRAAAVQATFFFSDPALTVTIDAVSPPQQGGDFNVYYGDPPLEAPLKLSLSADNAHRLWQGRLNVMLALSQNQIGIEGSMGRALALLPAVQPAFARYRAYLGEIGRPDLLA
jgi:hypothetical protein